MGVHANLAPPSIVRPILERDETESLFNPKQIRALEALVTRQPGESLAEVAERAQVGRVSLYRWFKDPAFHREYRERVAIELSAKRSTMAEALVRGASAPGPGQAAMQKMYWQLVGDFKESLEISGPNGQPIQIQEAVLNVESLPLWLKQALVVVGSGRAISPELERALMDELGAKYLEVEYEILAKEGNGNGVSSNQQAGSHQSQPKQIGHGSVNASPSCGQSSYSFTKGSAHEFKPLGRPKGSISGSRADSRAELKEIEYLDDL